MDDFDNAAKILDSIAVEAEHLTEQELLELGHLALDIIVLRTKRGMDVDGRPFVPYSDEYRDERQKHGLSTTPDLAVKGHMMGSIIPKLTGPGEVSLAFTSPLESTKAAVHNFGSNSNASVKSHSRSVFVTAMGQRASQREIALDRRRKSPRLKSRNEAVGAHTRKMNTPKREFFDIRQPEEVDVINDAMGQRIVTRIEKTLK